MRYFIFVLAAAMAAPMATTAQTVFGDWITEEGSNIAFTYATPPSACNSADETLLFATCSDSLFVVAITSNCPVGLIGHEMEVEMYFDGGGPIPGFVTRHAETLSTLDFTTGQFLAITSSSAPQVEFRIPTGNDEIRFNFSLDGMREAANLGGLSCTIIWE